MGIGIEVRFREHVGFKGVLLVVWGYRFRGSAVLGLRARGFQFQSDHWVLGFRVFSKGFYTVGSRFQSIQDKG